MQRRTISNAFLMIGIAVMAGCGPKPVVPNPPVPAVKPEAVVHLTESGPDHAATDNKAPGIGREDVDVVLELDIYQAVVPCGGISSNDKFWKHIDEDHVNLATHELLLKNGVRYGIGRNDEWDYFKALIERTGAKGRPGSNAPTRRGSLELPLRTNIETQDVFYFDQDQILHGRTYDKCDDILVLTFEPTPRRPGDSRIALSAMVRGLVKQFVTTPMNDVHDIEYRYPEYLYDLRLREDVPFEHFLVIAPTPTTSFPHNLGHSFFVNPGGAEPMEAVLLLVPRPFRIDGQGPKVLLNRAAPGK